MAVAHGAVALGSAAQPALRHVWLFRLHSSRARCGAAGLPATWVLGGRWMRRGNHPRPQPCLWGPQNPGPPFPRGMAMAPDLLRSCGQDGRCDRGTGGGGARARAACSGDQGRRCFSLRRFSLASSTGRVRSRQDLRLLRRCSRAGRGGGGQSELETLRCGGAGSLPGDAMGYWSKG